MDTNPNGNKRIAAIIGLVVIVAAIGAAAFAFAPKKSQTAVTSAIATPAATASTLEATATPAAGTATPAAASAYKDGTYKATGTYRSPGGTETIGVTITLAGGKVTDSSVASGSQNPTGKEYQGEFISGYKSFVTGKDIDTISLSKVSGSSLTSGGFNNALSQIKSQAKA